MATAGDITVLAIKTYESNIRHLAQQRYAKLLNWCTLKHKGSGTDHFYRMAARAMTSKAAGRVATPVVASAFTSRVAIPTTQHSADTIEKEDAAKTLTDPKAAILQAQAAAAARALDALLIAAAFSDTIKDEVGDSNSFPAGQKMTAAALDLAYVTKVQELFLTNNIDPSEPKVFVVSPAGAKALLNLATATSDDYVNAKALAAQGFVSSWMGFDWICSTQLGLHDTNQRDCIAMTRKALGLLMVKDIEVDVGTSVEYSFDTVIYNSFTAGATRIEDEHIVKATIVES